MKFPKAHKIKKPFEYTHSSVTDIRKSIRKEQERLKQSNVSPLRPTCKRTIAVGSGLNKTGYLGS